MTGSAFAALLGVWFAAIVSPGPDTFQIIRIGSRDRAAGVWAAVGITLGNAFWIIASLLGLSALVQTVPQILTVLQIVGGGYLLYMGLGALWGGVKARVDKQKSPDVVEPAARAMSTTKAFAVGVATNLSNPKAILFFGAIFAQFIRPGMGWQWMVAIAATLIITGLAWFVGFALAVRALARPIQQHGWAIDLVTGLIFIAIAVWMLIEGLAGLPALF